MCACGSAFRTGPAFEPLPAPTARYDTDTAQVFVRDERRGVSRERAFDTPFFSWPGDGAVRPLAISSEAEEQMAALLQRSVPRLGSDRLYFEIHVLQANAGWRENWFSEEARANVELRICAIDGTDNSALIAGASRSSADAKSADITDGEPAKLLDAAVLNAWGRWLRNDRVIAAVNQALTEKHRWGRMLHAASCSR
jgi:hypothetical protein